MTAPQHQADDPAVSTTRTMATTTITTTTNKPKPKAKLVSLDSLTECGTRLRNGDLVAFPTETVYGLGCHALDESAIAKVFQAKERPLTDPLISHVTDPQVAFNMWSCPTDSIEEQALQALTTTFWPGPLTLVAKAAAHVPPTLMANTGYCACRAPQHPISIALIEAAQVPLAAPSANKFGHVSPTKAQHVWDDLWQEDVWILNDHHPDGDDEHDDAMAKHSSSVAVTETVCQVGVESSVAKLEMISEHQGQITLLRQGAVAVADLQACLDQAGLGDRFVVQVKTKRACPDTVATVAPGQTIRHYSPDIPSFILSESRYQDNELSPDDKSFLSHCVLIDFGGKLQSWENHALAYRELSPSGTSSEATKAVFETLRWAEQVEGGKTIIFPEIVDDQNIKLDALTLALKDRLTRAASGVVIDGLKAQ